MIGAYGVRPRGGMRFCVFVTLSSRDVAGPASSPHCPLSSPSSFGGTLGHENSVLPRGFPLPPSRPALRRRRRPGLPPPDASPGAPAGGASRSTPSPPSAPEPEPECAMRSLRGRRVGDYDGVARGAQGFFMARPGGHAATRRCALRFLRGALDRWGAAGICRFARRSSAVVSWYRCAGWRRRRRYACFPA